MTARRQLLFYVITFSVPLIVALVMFMAYLGVKKLTFSYGYCGSYGMLDDEVGWRLKPDATSCISLKNHLAGTTYFDTRIYTNNGGFRDAKVGGAVPAHALMTIGDSWTFGYGVDFEESFPYFLSQTLGAPLINAGIPAYGSGSNLLLAARNIEKHRPSVVIYHTRGMHTRSLCSQIQAESTLLPCFYFADRQQRVVLAKPKPGAVAEAAKHNVYPGGSLTAGYDSLLRFMLFVRIPEIASELRQRWTAVTGMGHPATPGFDDKNIPAVLQLELMEYRRLSEQYGFAFVLVDPVGTYRNAFVQVFGDGSRAIYVGAPEWESQVAIPVRSLADKDAWVPMDGHYGREQNRIIGGYLARVLRERAPDQLKSKG
jgi:hypothetical protein